MDLFNQSAEEIFATLLRAGNGGVKVRSTAAPALATQFVKSHHQQRASAGIEGSFAEIIYPQVTTIEAKIRTKHEHTELFGYIPTARSDAFSGGYGERSAQALSREESTFQLKGTFPAATIAYSKLRARVDARNGDANAIDQIFTTLWGLPEGSTDLVPKLYLSGNEATRMAAMEDRAYHSLSAHPAFNGGYRVDTATLAPDAIDEDVPLNWPRLRTALKAIALTQVQGDLTISTQITNIVNYGDFRFRMDIVRGSQPYYVRPYPWEILIKRMTQSVRAYTAPTSETGCYFETSNCDTLGLQVEISPDLRLRELFATIAHVVSHESSQSLSRTVEVLLAHDRERAALLDIDEEGLTELDRASVSMSVEVPRWKLMRTSLHRGMRPEFRDSDRLPDVRSRGKPTTLLDLREMREAHLTMPGDLASALHMAVYINTMRSSMQPHAYRLMAELQSISPRTDRRASERLRDEALYSSDRILSLGPLLFGRDFVNVLDTLLRNMATRDTLSDITTKNEMWKYLNARCKKRRDCPITGGWRDLIDYVHQHVEGWSLYYWVRMTIGKQHHSTVVGILAPIAAGVEMDALTVCREGVRDRIRKWKDYYTAQYRAIESSIASAVLESAERRDHHKYIPPHLRQAIDLETQYDADTILNRTGGYKEEQYQKMVEMQTKAKLFAAVDVYTCDRRVIVGMTNPKLREMLVEFYQARWYSLHKRIERANSTGKVFKLGLEEFPVHPWGELVTEFPMYVEDVLQFMQQLDMRAWTLPPTYLYEKMMKSISELWEDVNREVESLRQYVSEVHAGLAEQQEEIDASRLERTVTHSLAGVPPIPIPVHGYRDMKQLPTRVQEVQAPIVEELPEDNDLLDDLLDDGLDEGPSMSMSLGASLSTSSQGAALGLYTSEQTDCISLRVVWHVLGLDATDDTRMKYAFGVPHDIDLDAPQLDPQVGPVHMVGDENKVQKSWATRKVMILSRLSRAHATVVEDDM